MAPLTTDPTPDWAQAGRRTDAIAFFAYRSGNRDLWVMPSRGGPARQLTSGPARDINPTWSPDGREIAFYSRRTGRQAVWIVNANGGAARLVTATPGGSLEWLRDGSGFVVITRDGDSLYRVAKDGGEPVLLARMSVPPFSFRVSRDGQWRLSLGDRKVSRLTKLEGRRGNIGDQFATEGRCRYFTWREDDGEIWVMDVGNDVSR
jgi:dipeptidyl aminopeptidase/acylaminoacyl peptidase